MVNMSSDDEIRYISRKEAACDMIKRSVEDGRKMLSACGRERRPDQFLSERFETFEDTIVDILHLAVAERLQPHSLIVEAYCVFLKDEEEAEVGSHDSLYQSQYSRVNDFE